MMVTENLRALNRILHPAAQPNILIKLNDIDKMNITNSLFFDKKVQQ